MIGLQVAALTGSAAGVDDGQRVAGHLQDRAGQAGQPLPRVDRELVDVSGLGVGDLAAGRRSRARRRARREHRVVPGVVVVDTGHTRLTAGYLSHHSWEGVRRELRHGPVIFQAMSRQSGQHRVWVRSHVPGEVLLMQSVHGDQQHVPDLAAVVTAGPVGAGAGQRGCCGQSRPCQQRGRHSGERSTRPGERQTHDVLLSERYYPLGIGRGRKPHPGDE